MKSQIKSALPTIYADMNVFRYVACGELVIKDPESFKWVYSYAHLSEVSRGENTDALDGMKQLKAVEIEDILDVNFTSVGNIILRNYFDPHERYQQIIETIAGYENSGEALIEYMLRLCGADNLDELSNTPEIIRNEVHRLTADLDNDARSDLINRAEEVSDDLKEHIKTDLKEKLPIDQTRKTLGLTSSKREDAANSESPIESLWEIIGPTVEGKISKDQFFGFEPNPAIHGVPHTQHGALCGAHMVLNMLGLSPDKGLAKRGKIRNILSDGQHVGMASYCNGLLSADKRFCDKANAIYTHIGSNTRALWFQYKPEGCVVQLKAEEASH